MKMAKVLLYSGGMDSWLIARLWRPDIKLYIDTGTPYAAEEISRLPPDVVVERLDLARFEREDKIIPLRNLYFVILAANYGDEIMLGATYGDRVLDKSLAFAEKASDMLSFLYSPQHWTPGRKIRACVDYKRYTKAELLKMYLEQGGDLETAFHESFSCYEPDANGHECWRCKPCARKAVAFLLNGYKPQEAQVIAGTREYVSRIMPEIRAGIYGRGPKEENEIVRAYRILEDMA